MSAPDDFDARLARQFEREHRQVSADPFVAETLRRIGLQRRRSAVVRTALGAAALVAMILASPWLIAGVSQLNAALEAAFTRPAGFPLSWVLGALAIAGLLVSRLRSR
jgi:hypothetical protein